MIGNMKTAACGSCQAEMDADAIFCNECGAMQAAKPASAAPVCPKCHKPAAVTDKFCRSCAFKLQKNENASNGNDRTVSKDNLLEVRSVPPLPPSVENKREINNRIESFNHPQFEKNYKSAETAPRVYGESKPVQEKSFASVTPGKATGSHLAAVVMKRYTDGYRVARALNGIGTVVKVIGLIFGVGIFLLGLLIGQSMMGFGGSFLSASDSLVLFMLSIFTSGIQGAIIGVILWIIGVRISAQGQILKAQLDSAVHSSPFLSDAEMAQVMSLSAGIVQPDNSGANYFSGTALEPNIKASLAYGLSFIFGILWLPVPIYFLLTAPNEDRFLRLHSFQSIILNIVIFIVGLFGKFAELQALFVLAVFASVIANLFCIWGAYNNGKSKLPVIGDIAVNLAENNSNRNSY